MEMRDSSTQMSLEQCIYWFYVREILSKKMLKPVSNLTLLRAASKRSEVPGLIKESGNSVNFGCIINKLGSIDVVAGSFVVSFTVYTTWKTDTIEEMEDGVSYPIQYYTEKIGKSFNPRYSNVIKHARNIHFGPLSSEI